MEITYISDPVPSYTAAITAAKNRDELQDAIAPFSLVAADAREMAGGKYSFDEFRKGLRKERRGRFAGEDWAEKFAAIIMPEIMFRVSAVAQKFNAPWGVTYIRLKDAGRIIETDGQAKWVDGK